MNVPDKSCLNFSGYRFDSIHFDVTPGLIASDQFSLLPTFTKKISADGGNIEVQLSMKIESTPESVAPFSLHLVMTGSFVLEMDQENEEMRKTLINNNTVAIMFPFLRSAVSTLTTTANFPPLLLPVINLAAFLNDDSEDESCKAKE